MDPAQFDAATRLFASGRAAEEAAPAAAEVARKVMYLFVQTFRSGTVAAKADAPGTYTVTLAEGTGQTVYFSDRPDRVVGLTPTAQFLAGMPFGADNPPNAALVVEPRPGETEIAVVELFEPRYDEATHTATYDAKVLAAYEGGADPGFTEQPGDLAAVAPRFGAAHLLIDDCPDANVSCWKNAGYWEGDDYIGDLGRRGTCYQWQGMQCIPCNGQAAAQAECNARFPACDGQCVLHMAF
jgi:hypothetical protein